MTPSITRKRLGTEEMVRIILTAPGTVTAAELSRRCGISREAVRQIRMGQLHRKVLPNLPRSEPGIGYRRCWHCKLAVKNRTAQERMRWHGAEEPRPWCSLGFPESIEASYARECPVFEPVT